MSFTDRDLYEVGLDSRCHECNRFYWNCKCEERERTAQEIEARKLEGDRRDTGSTGQRGRGGE